MSSSLTGGSEVPVVVVSSVPESLKITSGSATNSFSMVASTVGDVPSLLFDTKEEREKLHKSSVEEFARSKALTPVDGLAKGIAALGGSLVKGLTGVVTEPIRGASEKGAEGFFSGIGKGLLGVVFKPIGGVLELGGKVGEGFVNTPETIVSLVNRSAEYVMFGIPLLESFEKCKSTERKHVWVRVMEVFAEQRQKPTEGLFVFSTPAKLINDLALAYDQGLDPDIFPLDPFISVGLLMRYLERLPEPVIPVNFQAPLNTLILGYKRIERTDPVVNQVHQLLNQLPAINKSILHDLCLAIRRYLHWTNSGSIALDHVALLVGRLIFRTDLITSTTSTTSASSSQSAGTTGEKDIPVGMPTPTGFHTPAGLQSPAPSSAPNTVDEYGHEKVEKPQFATIELRTFTLNATRLLIRFYCPGYLTYQLHKSEYNMEM
jgi:hypothetical protein